MMLLLELVVNEDKISGWISSALEALGMAFLLILMLVFTLFLHLRDRAKKEKAAAEEKEQASKENINDIV